MKTYQDYIDEFSVFVESTIHENKPNGDARLQGTPEYAKTYFANFMENMKNTNNELSEKARILLAKIAKDKSINYDKIEADFLEIGKKALDTFIALYKP